MEEAPACGTVTVHAGRYRRELVHDGQRYFIAYALLAAEPFLLVPLLLSFMSAGTLGALGAVEALVVVLCGVTQLGVKFAYLQHVADVGGERRGPGFWTATVLTVATGLLAGVLAAPLLDSPWLAGILGQRPGIRPLTLGGLLALTNLQMMLVTDLRARRNPLPFALSSALRLGATVLLVALWGPAAQAPLDAVLLAQALAYALSASLLAWIARVPGRPLFDAVLARRFLGYGWPIAAGNLVKYGTDALLPWLCLALVSPLAAGAMALAMKVSAVFDSAFGQPFLMAWGGRAYAIAAEGRVREFFPALFRWMLWGNGAAAVFACAVGYMIIEFFSGAEHGLGTAALALLPMAVVGRMLFTLHFPAAVGFIARRDMRWNIWVALSKAAVFAVLGPVGFMLAGAPGGWLAFVMGDLGALVFIYQRGARLLALEGGGVAGP